jgi:predicted transcriptional regulator
MNNLAQTGDVTRERAAEFLGQGYSQEMVASIIGVSPERISQLMSESEFREAVRSKRIQNLQAQTQMDKKYDTLEEKLLAKLEKAMPLFTRPRDILDAIKTVNGAKRRGAAPEPTAESAKVVSISVPVQVVGQFISVEKTSNNQIIQAGEQALLTVSPNHLAAHVASNQITNPASNPTSNPAVPKELPHDTGSGARQAGIPGKTREICASDLD